MAGPIRGNKESKDDSSSTTTVSSTSSSNAAITLKTKQLNTIIPIQDVRRMTNNDWMVLYESEKRTLVTDSTFGGFQINITEVQRYHIVSWMSEACTVLGWTAQTFFIAVHALDSYVTAAAHELMCAEFGPLATACLYFAAHLMESATDENVCTLEKFQTVCPEVGQSEVVREAQVHLLDTLQGRSLCRKTPLDFFVLYLARLKESKDKDLVKLFDQITSTSYLAKIYDLVCSTSLVIYTSGLVFYIPGSTLVQCTMLQSIKLFLQSGKMTEHLSIAYSDLLDKICQKVFSVPRFSSISAVFDVIGEVVLVCSRIDYRRPTTRSTSRHQQNNENPLDWIKHLHPDGFSQLPYVPQARVTKDIAVKLTEAVSRSTLNQQVV